MMFPCFYFRTKCTVGADSMDCWEKNENYFINQLIEIANGLAGVEVMIGMSDE